MYITGMECQRSSFLPQKVRYPVWLYASKVSKGDFKRNIFIFVTCDNEGASI